MAGNSAIWRVATSAANGTEATAGSGNTVLFNEEPIVTLGGMIFESEFNIRNSVPENSRVAGNNNEIQDMGLDGIDVTISGTFLGAEAGNPSITKLMTWFHEAKYTTGYTEGRFGLRLDDFPYFNMVPTSTYGYVIQNIQFKRVGEEYKKVGFVITLRLGGAVDSWFTANGF